MRTPDEIQKAHDVLWSVLMNETPVTLFGDSEIGAHAALDVLCWILRHDHNKAFEENLEKLLEEIKRNGGQFVEKGNVIE